MNKTDWEKEFINEFCQVDSRGFHSVKGAGYADPIIRFIAEQRAKAIDELVEKAKEEQKVMAHIVGAKRVETPWISIEDLEDIAEEIKRK